MDRWKVLQVSVISGVLTTSGAEVIGKRHDVDHSHQKTPEALGQQIGRDAVKMAEGTAPSSGPLPINRVAEGIARQQWWDRESEPSFASSEMIRRQKLFVHA
jgi:hypothetical protein